MTPGAGDRSTLVEHLTEFTRTLRRAGLRIGTGELIDACNAIALIGVSSRSDIASALAAVLLTSPDQRPIFNQAFHVYFKNPEILKTLSALLLPSVDLNEPVRGDDAAARRLLEALGHADSRESENRRDEHDIDSAHSASDREYLRERDFAQMSLLEQAAARRLLDRELSAFASKPVRRLRAAASGSRIDLRRTLGQAVRSGGELMRIARKRPRTEPPRIVILCDISGSMAAYSRLFLHFAHTLSRRQQHVATFLFGTRLSNITRSLCHRDVDQATKAVSGVVDDWDGGTRISEALYAFNRQWSRRLMSRRTVVLLLSDGLEREPDERLSTEAARLHRNAWRVLWLNPLLSYAGFQARAGGITKLLPHVDELLPGYNISNLIDLSAQFGASAT